MNLHLPALPARVVPQPPSRHFCVADYLAELDKVHVVRYSTRPERAFHLPLRRGRFSDQMVGTLRSEQLKGHCAKSRHQRLRLVNANFAMR